MNTATHTTIPTLSIMCDDGTQETVTVADFLRDNADDVETCEMVARLERGGHTACGGGAAPLFLIVRIA
jgi:hypothetical protein